MADNLLKYLTRPNPLIYGDNSLGGYVTRNNEWPTVPDVRDWSDFTYDTLLSCYGGLLGFDSNWQFPGTLPRVSGLECEVWDEDSLEHLLSRSIVPAVSVGLAYAWELCYEKHSNRVDITRGGRAKKCNDNHDDDRGGDDGKGKRQSSKGKQGSPSREPKEDSRGTSSTANGKSYPDWAGVVTKENQTQGYINRCPGETKLSTKWESTDHRDDEFFRPISQILSYCGGQWDTRYGYIITQSELVVLRFSRETIGSGLAAGRSPRVPPGLPLTIQSVSSSGHQRNTPVASTARRGYSREASPAPITPGKGRSSISSTGSGSVFEDDLQGVEYLPVEMKSIPWDNEGEGKLTVKLALWWIHMLAAAPGCQSHIGNTYPPLNSWVELPGKAGYQHLSAGIHAKDPKKGRRYDYNTGRVWVNNRGMSPPRQGSPAGKGKAPEQPRKR